MEIQIQSRKLKRTLTYWANDNGGYIYVDYNGESFRNGNSLCDGGNFSGGLLRTSSNKQEFEEICKKWHKNFIKNI